MILDEKIFFISKPTESVNLITYFKNEVLKYCDSIEAIPVRFVVAETTDTGYRCELGVLIDSPESLQVNDIFEFKKRTEDNQDKFNAVVLVPTGIGAKLGGHSGDGGAMIRLLSSVCDTLITHPNVVNAADINELPENSLYVEGSVISQFLMGTAGLKKVRANRVLVVADEHHDLEFYELAVNSVSAARVALGMEFAAVVKLKDVTTMKAYFTESGCAVGRIENFESLVGVLEKYKGDYDAVAITSCIDVPENLHGDYFKENMEVNPWGGVEAMLTHAVSMIYNIPSAHSPMMTSDEVLNLDVGIVDPRKAAEVVSMTYLHCILKGLYRSPRIVKLDDSNPSRETITVADISCLVIPEGCIGLPTLAAVEHGMHVIVVKENGTTMKNNLNDLPFKTGRLHVVENYLEAVGVMASIKAGIAIDSIRRPIGLIPLDDY